MAPAAIVVRQDAEPSAPRRRSWLARLLSALSWRRAPRAAAELAAMPSPSDAYRTAPDGALVVAEPPQEEVVDESSWEGRERARRYKHQKRMCGGYCQMCEQEHRNYTCPDDCKLCEQGTAEQAKQAEDVAKQAATLFKETFPLVLASSKDVDVDWLHDQCARAIDMLGTLERLHRERVKKRLLEEHRARRRGGEAPAPPPRRPPVPDVEDPGPPKRIAM
jgi:hypothetical protein